MVMVLFMGHILCKNKQVEHPNTYLLNNNKLQTTWVLTVHLPVVSGGSRPCGVTEKWTNQRGLFDCEGHGEEGEAVSGSPLRPGPCRAPPPGPPTGCWALGGGERLHPPTPHVRPPNHQNARPSEWSVTRLLSWFFICFQVYPESRAAGECFSDHVHLLHPPGGLRGLPVPERVHPTRGEARRQTARESKWWQRLRTPLTGTGTLMFRSAEALGQNRLRSVFRCATNDDFQI